MGITELDTTQVHTRNSYMLIRFLFIFFLPVFATYANQCTDIFPGTQSFTTNSVDSIESGVTCNGSSCNPGSFIAANPYPTYSSSGNFNQSTIVGGTIYGKNNWRIGEGDSVTFSGSGTAIIYIKNDATIKEDVEINKGGDPANVLLIFNKKLKIEKGAEINAFIYVNGSETKIEKNSTINGGIAAKTKLILEKNSTYTYTPSDANNLDVSSFCSGAAPSLDHYEIIHDGAGSTCENETVTINACANADCSTSYPSSVSVDFTVDGINKHSATFTDTTTFNFAHDTTGNASIAIDNESVTADNPLICSGNNCNILYSSANCPLSVSIKGVAQDYNVASYGGTSQDRTGTVEIRDAGLSLFLEGNRWQKIDFPYTVTENTVIEFDFQSTTQGEVQGVGFDTDLSISSDRSFKVYGTQSWGISNYDNYPGNGVTHYSIPVGQFYTGNFQYLFFMNDDDSNPTGNSLYSNINVHEGQSLTGNLNVDNTFEVYISTDDSVQGTLLTSGTDWPTTYNLAASLTAGQTYYLHIKATDTGGVAGFLGDFNITDSNHTFSNGLTTLNTNTTDWTVSTTGWNNYQPASSYGTNGVSPWGTIAAVDNNAQWIWSSDNDADNITYFSTIISPPITTPLLEYRFEENNWDGSADEILDNTGNGHHARVNNNSTPETTTPALTGNPGTCGYASQNDGSIQVTGLPLDTTTAGVKTTVTFWMKWDGTDSVMPIGWNEHDIWIRNGSIGFNTWSTDIYGISSAALINGWHHIAVEFTNGNVTSNRMHIDGVEQVLTQRFGSPNNANAYVNSQMRVGGVSNSSNYDFHGLLDEFRVYQSALTTAEIETIMAERHPCTNTPVVHHYEVIHDGQGLTCDAETITIKACTNESCSTESTESISLDLLANGTLKSSVTFTGTTTVNVSHTAVGTLTFSLNNETIAPDNPLICSDGSSNNCDMAFSTAGFRFLSGTGTNTTIPNQTAGAVFSDSLKLQAVKDTNGVCTGIFDGNTAVDLSQENVDPGGTNGLSFSVGGNPIAKHSSTTSTTLSFGTNSIATLSSPIYHDAGQIRLHANYSVGGVTLTGSSNAFWVSPAELVITATSGATNLIGATATATPTHAAGEDFTLSVSAYNAATPAVVTPNYSPGQVQLKLTRTGPTFIDQNADGSLTYAASSTLASDISPSFNDASLTSFVSGESIYTTAQYSEVGLLNLDAQDSNYGNANIVVPATAINIGRFIPDHFKQTIVNNGSFFSTCNTGTTFAYSGQKDEATDSIGAISYPISPVLLITAYNKQEDITRNYYEDSQGSTNDYMKLSAAGVSVSVPTTDQVKTGVNGDKLPLTANMNTGTLSQNDLTTSIPSDNPLAKGELHYQFSDDDHFFYNRSANAVVTPFTSDITFSIATITDADSVNVTTTVDASPTGIEIRFGRLVLKNSFGPETSNLPQQMQIEHFDGTGFIVSSNNDCVSYDASKISLTNVSLDPALTDKLGGAGDFIEGKTQSIELEATGDGNRGNIGVSYDAYDWLKYDWSGNDIYNEDPSAVATFGLYRGNDRIIYTREIF